ncbi:hypothetical protein A9Q68_01330 [Streptococcus bovimastitidis]|uniref:Thioesterase domain-containing protein n=2 Tax=Streptococcus TaxID=1301 RepID=A0A1L8MN86_9STRE|nr:PaaI family thioesterase [Streptococcus bovimastitidis]OJF72213.1 hypothetical protein A9Q68_01330 [Streptococcus bovimastitidis]
MKKEDIELAEIRVFENYKIETLEAGHAVMTTEVVEHSLNYYNISHGGYLFTLCDQVGGLVAKSLGVNAVTLQANINYLKASRLGETLWVEGKAVHSGRTTQVVDVEVKNKDGKVLTKVSLTLYITGKIEEN